MAEPDPARAADAREREADVMERRSQRLQAQIEGVRQDWERKQADDAVPGAPPPRNPSAEARKSVAPEALEPEDQPPPEVSMPVKRDP